LISFSLLLEQSSCSGFVSSLSQEPEMKIKADYQGTPVTVAGFSGRFAVLDSGERVPHAEVFQFEGTCIQERFSDGESQYKAVPLQEAEYLCTGCAFRIQLCGALAPSCIQAQRADKQDIIWVKE
jgi:hypothetical protein